MELELIKLRRSDGKYQDCIGYDCTCGFKVVRDFIEVQIHKMSVCEKCTSIKYFNPLEINQLQTMLDLNCNE